VGDKQTDTQPRTSMRGGESHHLVASAQEDVEERSVRYRCSRCGEGYQVRTSAPSCRIRFLQQIEQFEAPYASLQPTARRAVLEELVRRRLRWPRPLREAMLDQFERWQAWKTLSAISDSA